MGIILLFSALNSCDFCTAPTSNGGDFENILIFSGKSANTNQNVLFSSTALGSEIKAVNNKSIEIYSSPSMNSKIAYTKFDGFSASNSLYISDLDGGNETFLIKESGLFQILNPIISADAKKICFNGGFNRLLIYDMQKSSINQISSKLATNAYPTFSPDGKKLAFIENDNSNMIKIKVIDTDNLDLINIFYDNVYDGFLKSSEIGNFVNWNYDNKRIAFSFSNNGRDIIKIINIETRSEQSFDYSSDNIGIENPAVNFSKNILVFKANDGNLWARNLAENDSRLFQLTVAVSNEFYYNLGWSPDEKYLLAGNSYKDASNFEYKDLVVFDIDKENSIPKTENLYLISNNANNGFWKSK